MQAPDPHARIQIAFYFADLSGGGVEKMRLHLAYEMSQRGYRVSLILGCLRGALAGAIPSGIEVIILNTANTRHSILPLARHLYRAPPDILFSSLLHNNVAALLAGIVSLSTTKIIVCQHNALSREASENWRNRVIPLFYRLLSWRASAFVAVSDGVADDLSRCARIPRNKIRTIYNPVISSHARHDYPGPPPHEWFYERPTPLIFVGRLEPQKNPELALIALKDVWNSGQRLVFVGEGSLLGLLKKQAVSLGLSQRVLFHDFERSPMRWIFHSSALIVTSQFEGFSNVIAEALACGTPVISTDCDFGPSEILDNGRFGTLISLDNRAALTQAIDRVSMIPWDRNQLRARGTQYSVGRSADGYEDLIRAVLFPTEVFGCALCYLSAHEIIDLIINDRRIHSAVRTLVTPNIAHIRLLENLDFAAAYRRARIITADGAPIAAYARSRLGRKINRVTGCDIIAAGFANARFRQKQIFIVAESDETACAIRIWAERSSLSKNVETIVAPQDLLCKPHEQIEIVRAIQAHFSQIVILTIGAPASEIFADTHRAALAGCWALCVGQAVRVELGLTKRAPQRWRAAGMEALWRITQEPARLLPRYVRAIGAMPGAILQDWF